MGQIVNSLPPNLKTLEELRELVQPNMLKFYRMRDTQDIAGLQELSVTLTAQMFSAAATWSYWNSEELSVSSSLENDRAKIFMIYKVTPNKLTQKYDSDEICKTKARADLAPGYTNLAYAKGESMASKILHDDIKDAVATIRQIISTLKAERGAI